MLWRSCQKRWTVDLELWPMQVWTLTNTIIFIRQESHRIKFILFVTNINRKFYLDWKLQPIYHQIGSSNHCLYKLAGFQSFQETVFIKKDLTRGHFYTTIEEVKTAIKQYFKVHYFICLNCPRRLKNGYSSGIALMNTNNSIRRGMIPDE